MSWPDPGEDSEVKTTILDGNTVVNKDSKQWSTRKDSKDESGTWT